MRAGGRLAGPDQGLLDLLCASVGPLSGEIGRRIAGAGTAQGSNNHARFPGTPRILRFLVIVDKGGTGASARV